MVSEPQMDKLLTRLEQEHERIIHKMNDLLDVIPERRQERFRELQDLLVAHMQLEEEWIYPQLPHSDQHHEIKELLQRLNLVGDEARWSETYRYFRNAVIVHCKAEEADLFLQLRGPGCDAYASAGRGSTFSDARS